MPHSDHDVGSIRIRRFGNGESIESYIWMLFSFPPHFVLFPSSSYDAFPPTRQTVHTRRDTLSTSSTCSARVYLQPQTPSPAFGEARRRKKHNVRRKRKSIQIYDSISSPLPKRWMWIGLTSWSECGMQHRYQLPFALHGAGPTQKAFDSRRRSERVSVSIMYFLGRFDYRLIH